jgi:hypothetical protein
MPASIQECPLGIPVKPFVSYVPQREKKAILGGRGSERPMIEQKVEAVRSAMAIPARRPAGRIGQHHLAGAPGR